MSSGVPRLTPRKWAHAMLATVGVLACALVLALDGHSARAAGGPPAPISNAPALLPAPSCPAPPASETAPWADPKFGPDCQAQFVIDDLENPASPRYAQSAGGPAQSTLQRLEAAVATGNNLQPASGAATSLLALYGLTVSGATDDGADGERSNGLAFPSALDLGATWDTADATAYGADARLRVSSHGPV